jgi:hypothetical protein|tara:strand:+ start:7327 stop:7545 length:219 start_codon:yes stop_codon:yes gene_type:complete
MDISPETLIEIWNMMKNYIPKKERLDAAATLLNYYDANGDIEDFRNLEGHDSSIDTVLSEEYFEEEEEEEDF